MSYTAILVHADQTPAAAARLAQAVRVALACRAHLTALACTGLSRFALRGDKLRQWPLVPEQLRHWREQAEASLLAFDDIARYAGVLDAESRLVDDAPEDALLQQTPYHDLLVLGQTDPQAGTPGAIRSLPQELLLHCGRPLLVMPYRPVDAGEAVNTFHHPLLAWDGGRHAARAISDALPLLKLAQWVSLLVLNAEQHPGTHGAQPGADMALLLARHGVRIEVTHEYTTAAIGDALLGTAAELGCDLLVMGGYGHRRGRETLLGGTTRTVLRDMTLPVLISH